MEVIVNGWNIERDGRGYWAVCGVIHEGPFTRSDAVMHFARTTKPTKIPRETPSERPKPVKSKSAARNADNETDTADA